MKKRTILLLLLILSIFVSCSTVPVIEEEPVIVEEPVAAEPQAEAEPEPVVEEQPEEVIISDETGFEVSVELYEKTFDEMKLLIQKLNEIISDKNYEKWKLYLSDEYIKTYNDKTILKSITDGSQILSDNNIELLSLKDYFDWVVVPSRSKAWVDEIVFKDDTHLTAYILIKEKRTILYQLEKIEDKWLISVW